MFFYHFISSETDEVRAKREPSLCNESVKRYFFPTQLQLRPKLVTTLRELLLHVRFFSYIAAIETQIEFPILWCDSPSVSLEYPKLANALPSNFGPLRIFHEFFINNGAKIFIVSDFVSRIFSLIFKS